MIHSVPRSASLTNRLSCALASLIPMVRLLM